MFKFMESVTIRTRLIMLLVVPFAGLVYFSTTGVVGQYLTQQNVKHTGELAELASTASVVIHESQKERAASAGFIASRGTKFADELPRQRELTDKAITVFKEMSARMENRGTLDDAARSALSTAKSSLERLRDVRGQVTGFSIQPGDAIAFYSDALIGSLLAVTSQVSKSSSDVEMTVRLASYRYGPNNS